MKKLWLSVAFFAFISTGSLRAEYGMAGCGLGSAVFGNSGRVSQVFAATTNATFYSQLFGITSGTSNCFGDGEDRAQQFIDVNRVALERDISRGRGETLAALGQLTACSDPLLGEKLQPRYTELFLKPAPDWVPKVVLSAIRENCGS